MQGLSNRYHEPVLLNEVTEYLITNQRGNYLDCTLGGGGHAEAILNATLPASKVIGLDQDLTALEVAGRRLSVYGNRFESFHSSFNAIDTIAPAIQFDGILFDLGVSSRQIDDPMRGFSYSHNGPLDMRMNVTQSLTAYDLIKNESEPGLIKILKEFGEEKRSARAAACIKEAVVVKGVQDTKGLVKYLRLGGFRDVGSLSRIFQALRIAVNRELDVLKEALFKSIKRLAPKGRLVVLAYHSLEDRMVKTFLKDSETDIEPLFKKVIKPTPAELKKNRRSRSVRMRVGIKQPIKQ